MEHLLIVEGMTCGHCERAVTNALVRLDPQAKVSIDRSTKEVKVSSQQPRSELAQAVEEEGYSVAAA
ncbi:MAG: heavy-metal-associated domain-containing protein [Comamonadaceae bacterium]|nr:heavy-metal-associated domain-containing protein [Comamonadaceae bacterium]